MICSRIFGATSLALLLSFTLSAQLLPHEGAQLNHRLVGFKVPEESKAKNYVFEVAAVKTDNIDTFRKYTVISRSVSGNRVITEVPHFGVEYTWRVIYNGLKRRDTPFHYFSTEMCDRIDSTKYRLRVLQPGEQNRDLYIAIDGGGVIYDLKGKPVAYIPEKNGLAGFVADWQFTPEGTMTFNFGRIEYEAGLNGDIIWKTPEVNSVNKGLLPERYHHSFIKLDNGHYMTLGMEFLPCKEEVTLLGKKVTLSMDKAVGPGYTLCSFGTIIEFDADGNVVWSWKDSEHLPGSDFDYFQSMPDSNFRFDPHSNSIFLDKKGGYVYLSYRNLNRIIKIEYPGGKIAAIYGERYRPDIPSLGRDFFCNPHGVRKSSNGELYFFNNNSCWNSDSLPTVVILKEPAFQGDSLKKVWEFQCTVEGDYLKRFGAGGSVIELDNGDLLICMGNAFSKIFIVSRNKSVKWAALPERHIETDNIWIAVKQYKVNSVSRSLLEKLVWNAEERSAKQVRKQ